jgi:rRNA pseudouridine-1189 N-methylase Emg1 (Nep1/Mra1 family)
MPDWNPFWTDMAKIESGGRYPLLLNRFHDHMEDLLIKGIVSTTDRELYEIELTSETCEIMLRVLMKSKNENKIL